MTEEQLEALEEWIVAIIDDCDRASDLHESLHRARMKDEVLHAFGIQK